MEPGELVVREVPEKWLNQLQPYIRGERASVVLLPQYIENEIAVFDSSLTHSVKQLRSEGIDASFLAGGRGKVFRSTYSAEGAILLAVLLNLVSSAAWAGFVLMIRAMRTRLSERKSDEPIPSAVFRIGTTSNPDGSRAHWHEIAGPAHLVFDHAEATVRKYMVERDREIDTHGPSDAVVAQDPPPTAS